MNAVLMTQVEYAKHKGVGRSAVTNWKTRKLLVLAEGQDGRLLVDVTRTDAKLNANLDPMRGRPRAVDGADALLTSFAPAAPVGAAEPGVAEVRSELLREQITRERLRNAKDAGELVPVAEYERRAAELGRQTRERLQSALGNIAERLAIETDPRKLSLAMADAVDRVFGELASGLVSQAEPIVAAQEGAGGEEDAALKLRERG